MPKARAGETNDELTLNADLAPTILAATNIAAPSKMQGRDIATLYTSDKPVQWRGDYFYEHATIRNTDFIPSSEALVRKDWKYMFWPDFNQEQLFDLKADPLEENDVVADAKNTSVLEQMRERFAQLKADAK